MLVLQGNIIWAADQRGLGCVQKEQRETPVVCNEKLELEAVDGMGGLRSVCCCLRPACQ